MEVQQYNSIVDFVRSFKGLTQNCLKKLVVEFPHISYDTLYSILSLEFQRRMKTKHIKTQETKIKYYQMYQNALKNREQPGIIVRIAENFEMAPCLIAKLILAQHYERKRMNDGEPIETNMNVYLRDTTLIEDMDLAYEAFLCTLFDNIYSPLTEVMKGSLGQQYEIKLYRQVERLGLAFRDEEYLRKHGSDKTPDCKLEVPIAIDGCIVNWIESKALFGDADAHKEYMKQQYVSYWNRFGSGLVIYWFGYLETIVDPKDKRFIIRDHFPEQFDQLPEPDFDMT